MTLPKHLMNISVACWLGRHGPATPWNPIEGERTIWKISETCLQSFISNSCPSSNHHHLLLLDLAFFDVTLTDSHTLPSHPRLSVLETNHIMSKPELSSLLKWGVENSDSARGTNPEHPPSDRGLSPETLNALLGGPSDADLMKEAMQVIRSPEVCLKDKLIAFDNLEQLVENLDNANNLESLGLWTPLLEELDNTQPDMRMMAAWCVGTSVQNNVKSQKRLLALGGIPKLAKLAVEDKDLAVKKKSVYALSSCIRNYQPATDEAAKHLPFYIVETDHVSADDMATIDVIMDKLRGERKDEVE